MVVSNKKIMVLPGDGVGPEVIDETKKILEWFAKYRSLNFDLQYGLVGGAAYEKYGTPLTDETLADAMSADAILFGSVGGYQYEKLDLEKRPERGLLKLRKEMDLFANLRPAIVFPALANSSTLKSEIVSGLDILILRELTGGIYFAEPRGIETLGNGEKKGFDTNLYTTKEIERIGRVGFDLAKLRNKKVTSVEKSNVMMSGVLWREVITNLYHREGNEIELNHMYADNCAMQLVRNPKQFDVIVTDNLFGDILSDIAAMLTGSIGMLPSASLNDTNKGLYEPVHGSAPDIAGKDLANPLASILSVAMMMRYTFEEEKVALAIEQAVESVLALGQRTQDIAGKKDEAEKAFLWLSDSQLQDGSWYAEYMNSNKITSLIHQVYNSPFSVL